MKLRLHILLLSFVFFKSPVSYANFKKFTDTIPKKPELTFVKAEPIYDTVDVYASIDYNVWYKYILKHLQRFLQDTTRRIPAGTYTVQIGFVVETDGSISSAQALTNSGLELEEEAVKIFMSGPKWSPGIRKGEVVRSYRTQPIIFITEEQ